MNKSTQRWAGLTAVGGAVLFIGVFVLVGVVIGPDPVGTAGPITRFPDIRALRTVENSLYLAVIVLWIPLYLALYQSLRARSPGRAGVGATLGVMGLGVLAAGAIPHIVTTRLSDLYHDPAATPADQATLAALWQANQGLFDELLLVGLLLTATGITALGAAMPADPAFGRARGVVSVGLGVVGIAAGAAVLADPYSAAPAAGMIALIAFQLIMGWRLVTHSRTAA